MLPQTSHPIHEQTPDQLNPWNPYNQYVPGRYYPTENPYPNHSPNSEAAARCWTDAMIRSNPYNSRQGRYYAPVRCQFGHNPVYDARMSNYEHPVEPQYNSSDLVDLSSMSDRTNGLVIDISSDEEDDIYRNYRAESSAVPINGECTRQNCDLVSCSSRQSIAEVGDSLTVGDELNVRSGVIDSIHVIDTPESAVLIPNVPRRHSLPIMAPTNAATEHRDDQAMLSDRVYRNVMNNGPSPILNYSNTNETHDQPINLSNRLKRPGETVMVLKIIIDY